MCFTSGLTKCHSGQHSDLAEVQRERSEAETGRIAFKGQWTCRGKPPRATVEQKRFRAGPAHQTRGWPQGAVAVTSLGGVNGDSTPVLVRSWSTWRLHVACSELRALFVVIRCPAASGHTGSENSIVWLFVLLFFHWNWHPEDPWCLGLHLYFNRFEILEDDMTVEMTLTVFRFPANSVGSPWLILCEEDICGMFIFFHARFFSPSPKAHLFLLNHKVRQVLKSFFFLLKLKTIKKGVKNSKT